MIGAVGFLVFAATLAIATGEEVPRDNLLRNSEFDADLSSWQSVPTVYGSKAAPGGAVWSPQDSGSRKRSSGSLEIRTSAVSDRESFAVGQCLEVKRPMEYAIFGGRIRVAPDQAVAGFASLSVESFTLPGCAGRGAGNSTVQPIANADFWSHRVDRVSIRGASSLRMLAIVTKPYEWVEGDQTGDRDDQVVFRASFDSLFLRLAADETELPEPPRKPSAGFSAAEPVGKTSARWGRFTVEPPRLDIESSRTKKGAGEEAVAVYSSNEFIDFRVTLKHPYRYDDPQRYPIEGLSVAAENVSRGLLGRPTLEFLLYRADDPERTPLEIVLTSSGGGGVDDGGSNNSVGVRMAGRSEYRTRAIRTLYDCLSALRSNKTGAVPAPAPTPTDERLETLPLVGAIPLNPPGEYELVARYQAVAAGFWHEPIFSVPLRIRIVEKDLGCRTPRANVP